MARAKNAAQLEVRGMYDRDLVQAFDMIALAKGTDRTNLLERLLRGYVAQKQHEASLVSKSARINPPESDTGWTGLD